MHAEPKIDQEFAALCPALTPEERNLLEAGIERDGLLTPLVVWQEEGLLLDGHNRYEICKSLGIGCKTKGLSFPNRAAAVEWVITNQLGRRNLSDEQKSYLRGKRYQCEKKKHGGTGANQHKTQSNHSDNSARTVNKVADETGVSAPTILRDAKFAKAVDKLAEVAGPEVKSEILSGRSGLTKKDVVAIAEEPAEQVPAAIEAAKRGSSRSEEPSTDSDNRELSEITKLVERLNQLIAKVDALAARHGLGHNVKSRALKDTLTTAIKQAKAMGRSWRNE